MITFLILLLVAFAATAVRDRRSSPGSPERAQKPAGAYPSYKLGIQLTPLGGPASKSDWINRIFSGCLARSTCIFCGTLPAGRPIPAGGGRDDRLSVQRHLLRRRPEVGSCSFAPAGSRTRDAGTYLPLLWRQTAMRWLRKRHEEPDRRRAQRPQLPRRRILPLDETFREPHSTGTHRIGRVCP